MLISSCHYNSLFSTWCESFSSKFTVSAILYYTIFAWFRTKFCCSNFSGCWYSQADWLASTPIRVIVIQRQNLQCLSYRFFRMSFFSFTDRHECVCVCMCEHTVAHKDTHIHFNWYKFPVVHDWVQVARECFISATASYWRKSEANMPIELCRSDTCAFLVSTCM